MSAAGTLYDFLVGKEPDFLGQLSTQVLHRSRDFLMEVCGNNFILFAYDSGLLVCNKGCGVANCKSHRLPLSASLWRTARVCSQARTVSQDNGMSDGHKAFLIPLAAAGEGSPGAQDGEDRRQQAKEVAERARCGLDLCN